jgi:hypothetical protein
MVCPANTTLAIHQGGARAFQVNIRCTMTSYIDGALTYRVFTLTAISSTGTLGSVDYVQRRLTTTMTLS